MDKGTYNLLKTILIHPEISFAINSDKSEQLHYLESNKYIELKAETNLNEFKEPTKSTKRYYSVTIPGKTFIENHQKQSFDKWLTRLLSIAAFVISILALLKP